MTPGYNELMKLLSNLIQSMKSDEQLGKEIKGGSREIKYSTYFR
jgi:hypothetical protein